jgi:hypothetical protein
MSSSRPAYHWADSRNGLLPPGPGWCGDVTAASHVRHWPPHAWPSKWQHSNWTCGKSIGGRSTTFTGNGLVGVVVLMAFTFFGILIVIAGNHNDLWPSDSLTTSWMWDFKKSIPPTTFQLVINKKSQNSDLKCGKNICTGPRLQN